jgi:flagellar biosynthesis protein FliQ
MNVDDTMMGASIRQGVGALLGGGNLASSWGTYMIPAAIAKRPIPGGALLTGILCILASVLGYPMDLAMWEPVLRVALIVGVFLPLLEAGMQMIHKHKDSLSAGICIFSCAFVNPVFGWATTMLLDNMGFIGDRERAKELSAKDKYLIPGLAFVVCVGSLAVVGQLPGIPALIGG